MSDLESARLLVTAAQEVIDAALQHAAQVTNGGGGMPAFAGTLSPEEIEAVAEYVSGVAGTGGG